MMPYASFQTLNRYPVPVAPNGCECDPKRQAGCVSGNGVYREVGTTSDVSHCIYLLPVVFLLRQEEEVASALAADSKGAHDGDGERQVITGTSTRRRPNLPTTRKMTKKSFLRWRGVGALWRRRCVGVMSPPPYTRRCRCAVGPLQHALLSIVLAQPCGNTEAGHFLAKAKMWQRCSSSQPASVGRGNRACV